MGEGQRLERETLARLLQAEDVTQVCFDRLLRYFREEEELDRFLPDGLYRIDPRNGDRIVFNASRARRPHDNRPAEVERAVGRACIVCEGQTTGIVDVAELGEGFTFINKNLYPVIYPSPPEEGADVVGLHLLQWTSSLHDRDWHNLPLEDRVVVLERLAALERTLLEKGAEAFPGAATNPTGSPVFVSIIKNAGHLVGGSLTHGHQQILLSNVAPRRIVDDWRFEQERGESFAAYMLRENPETLLVRDYGPARLLVPYFMRRPYDLFLIVQETERRYLHDLSPAETTAVARGWHDALRAFRALLPELGRELAYNVVTHNGPGAGLYFEFLPYTQEMGGYEHLGLFISQGDPEEVAGRLRAYLDGHD